MQEFRLTKTKAALAVYDQAKKAFLNYEGPCLAREWERLAAEVDRANRAVALAFAEETTDRNSRENAMLVSADDPWLRELVRKYGEEEACSDFPQNME